MIPNTIHHSCQGLTGDATKQPKSIEICCSGLHLIGVLVSVDVVVVFLGGCKPRHNSLLLLVSINKTMHKPCTSCLLHALASHTAEGSQPASRTLRTHRILRLKGSGGCPFWPGCASGHSPDSAASFRILWKSSTGTLNNRLKLSFSNVPSTSPPQSGAIHDVPWSVVWIQLPCRLPLLLRE